MKDYREKGMKMAKEKGMKMHKKECKGDFGHGANRMYYVSTDAEKQGLKAKYGLKDGLMGYPSQAFDYKF